jgi:hypothetical protein
MVELPTMTNAMKEGLKTYRSLCERHRIVPGNRALILGAQITKNCFHTLN